MMMEKPHLQSINYVNYLVNGIQMLLTIETLLASIQKVRDFILTLMEMLDLT